MTFVQAFYACYLLGKMEWFFGRKTVQLPSLPFKRISLLLPAALYSYVFIVGHNFIHNKQPKST